MSRLLALVAAGVLLVTGLVGAALLQQRLSGGPLAEPEATPGEQVETAGEPSEAATSGAPTEPVTATPDPSPAQVPSPAPAVSESPGLVPADPDLAARMRRILRRAQVSGNVAVSMTNERGQTVFDEGGDDLLLPASTQKLVVAAAALARFGPEHRFTTTVLATAQPNARGVLDGDLVIIGGGDPALASPDFGRVEPDRPRTRVEQLADQIRAAGITRVNGRILADPSVLADQPAAPGWLPRYFTYFDATRSSGLTVDAGRTIERRGDRFQAEVSPDPARQTAVQLRRLLRARKVAVKGGVARVNGAPATVGEVARVQSPPLRSILRYMVQRSDNHLADGVFRMIGAADGTPTWAGAAAGTARALERLSLDWSGVAMADGSGLSRSNRMSAAFLTAVQGRMWVSSLASEWRPLMAVADESGTLRRRFSGTQAASRLYGKTGSLRDVRALTGTIVGPGTRRTDLTIVGNDLAGGDLATMRELVDRLTVVAAQDLYDCRRVRPRGRDRDGNRRPPRLVCIGA